MASDNEDTKQDKRGLNAWLKSKKSRKSRKTGPGNPTKTFKGKKTLYGKGLASKKHHVSF